MTPQEWSRIKEVLEVVLELEPSAHERYLDNACASREVNRVEIETLVRSYEESGTFLEGPVDIASMELLQEPVLLPWAGRRLA